MKYTKTEDITKKCILTALVYNDNETSDEELCFLTIKARKTMFGNWQLPKEIQKGEVNDDEQSK